MKSVEKLLEEKNLLHVDARDVSDLFETGDFDDVQFSDETKDFAHDLINSRMLCIRYGIEYVRPSSDDWKKACIAAYVWTYPKGGNA